MIPVPHTPARFVNRPSGAIVYVNTDLDLASVDDLEPLVAAFQAAQVFALHVTRGDGAVWFAVLETETQYDAPEPNIEAMVDVIEALPDELRAAWARCTVREFNIGYDCGAHPWGFTQSLSPALLRRVSALDASVRITLYPERERTTATGASTVDRSLGR